MAEIICIQEQLTPFEFRIRFTDGEERIVSVDPDKRGLFCNQQPEDKKSLACPFLAQRTTQKRVCMVHNSRPELCRNYLCARILILDREGKKAGRVLYGTRSFTTERRSLLDLWHQALRDMAALNDEQWEQFVDDLFALEGYRVIR